MDPSFIATLIERHSPRLAPSAAKFAERVYAQGLVHYADRLRQYGFAGRGAVLDAGCGFGQWAFALAAMNERVDACDISEVRVDFVNELALHGRVANLKVTRQDLTSLPYEDSSFDAVFCYGALHLTAWRTTLAELARVLRRDGVLYVNANGFGWYKHLWTTRHNGSPDYDPKLVTAQTLLNTCRYDAGEAPQPGMDVIIEPADLRARLNELGLDAITQDEEGCLGAADRERARQCAFFRGDYGGDLGVYEMIAHKRRSP